MVRQKPISFSVKHAPCGKLLTESVPPNPCIMEKLTDSPSPVPFPAGLVVKKGSNTLSKIASGIPPPVSITFNII